MWSGYGRDLVQEHVTPASFAMIYFALGEVSVCQCRSAFVGANDFQSWLLTTGTAMWPAGDNNWVNFGIADYNNDGIPDLYCMLRQNTGAQSTEVHVLDGASGYQSWTGRFAASGALEPEARVRDQTCVGLYSSLTMDAALFLRLYTLRLPNLATQC